MGTERGSSLVAEPKPESEPTPEALQLLDRLKEQAQDDSDLMGSYESVVDDINNYAVAKIRHVRYAENDVARSHLGDKYLERFNKMNESRNEAHNRLIESLGAYAEQSRQLGHNTAWWDGRDGLTKEKQGRSVRQRIDDWAMDVWMAWEDEQDQKEQRSAA